MADYSAILFSALWPAAACGWRAASAVGRGLAPAAPGIGDGAAGLIPLRPDGGIGPYPDMRRRRARCPHRAVSALATAVPVIPPSAVGRGLAPAASGIWDGVMGLIPLRPDEASGPTVVRVGVGPGALTGPFYPFPYSTENPPPSAPHICTLPFPPLPSIKTAVFCGKGVAFWEK